MDMKRIIFMVVSLLILGGTTNMTSAQGIFGGLLNKAKEKVKEKVERKVEDKADEATDNAINGKVGKKGKKVKGEYDDEEEGTAPSSKKGAKGAYAKSDFVRGEQVFFEDNLQGEQMGEFPSKWDLLEGNAEVAKMNGKIAIFMEASSTKITPLMKNPKNYLDDQFTIEFDYFQGDFDQKVGENKYTRGGYFFSLMDGDDCKAEFHFNETHIRWNIKKPGGDNITGETDLASIVNQGEFNHFALSFNKRALKVYINGQRVSNIPNAPQIHWLEIQREHWEDHAGNYLTNFIFAKGAVALYDRNATDKDAVTKAIEETGKFVTNNILFETGKATLKPESMEEIQKVAGYMKKNTGVRFEVQGHTDNQGSDKINDPLSQQRAEAVVKALEGLGVDVFNLRAVGKGAHEPVADNNTEEGRAKNRRVEFVKR